MFVGKKGLLSKAVGKKAVALGFHVGKKTFGRALGVPRFAQPNPTMEIIDTGNNADVQHEPLLGIGISSRNASRMIKGAGGRRRVKGSGIEKMKM